MFFCGAIFRIEMLRHIYEMFHVMFKLDMAATECGANDEELQTGASKLLLTCVGAGFRNMSKPVT
jgi:RNA 3'-terminal phosphate cyclase-like protein